MIDQGAIDQAEIHHLRRPRELQMVACAKAGEPVWPLKKFVTHSHAPSGSDQRKIGNRADMQIPRVVPTNHHCKGILKTERVHHLRSEEHTSELQSLTNLVC